MIKRLAVMLTSLLVVSAAFARGGNTVHVVLRPGASGLTVNAHIPVAPPAPQRRDAATQTDEPAQFRAQDIEASPEEDFSDLDSDGYGSDDEPDKPMSKPKQSVGDHDGELVVVPRALFDAVCPRATVVNSDSTGTTGIPLDVRFASLQDQDDIKRATQASLDDQERLERQKREEEELFQAVLLSLEPQKNVDNHLSRSDVCEGFESNQDFAKSLKDEIRS